MIDSKTPRSILIFPQGVRSVPAPNVREIRPAPALAAPWATPLVPILAPNDDPTPEIERAFVNAALAARAGEREARDALARALSGKIERIVAREARRAAATGGPLRDGRPWDREDLAQEAFCLLVALIDEWPGDGPFLTYLLAYLPWRLRDVRRRLAAPRRFETYPVPIRDEALADDSVEADEARVRLEAIADGLPPVERALLLGIVRDGERPAMVARRLGIDRRTANRRWASLLAELRPALDPNGGK